VIAGFSRRKADSQTLPLMIGSLLSAAYYIKMEAGFRRRSPGVTRDVSAKAFAHTAATSQHKHVITVSNPASNRQLFVCSTWEICSHTVAAGIEYEGNGDMSYHCGSLPASGGSKSFEAVRARRTKEFQVKSMRRKNKPTTSSLVVPLHNHVVQNTGSRASRRRFRGL
jgi:hypothetical protein